MNLDYILDYKPTRIVKPYSWVGHMPFAYHLVNLVKPSIIVELGTHSGNSLCAFAQSIKDNKLHTNLYAVDSWEGDPQAGFYDEEIYQNLKAYINQNYDCVTLVRSLFDQALNSFEDNSIDILHIDGLHTYEAVEHDFLTWKPKVKQDGVILFHDISEKKEGFDVHILWEKLKIEYKYLEFDHSHGLGVLFMPNALERESLYDFYKEQHKELFTVVGNCIRFEKLYYYMLEKSDSPENYHPEKLSKKATAFNLLKGILFKIKNLSNRF